LTIASLVLIKKIGISLEKRITKSMLEHHLIFKLISNGKEDMPRFDDYSVVASLALAVCISLSNMGG